MDGYLHRLHWTIVIIRTGHQNVQTAGEIFLFPDYDREDVKEVSSVI